MKEERRLTEWLGDYRDAMDGLATPERVEAVLRSQARRQRRIPVAPWLLAAGAAAVLVLGIWIGRNPPAEVADTSVSPSQVSSPVPVESPDPPALEVETAVQPARRLTLPRASRRPAPVPMMPEGPVAVFVMLPGSELMPPSQGMQVLRVRIPRTRIQALGLPVNVDHLEERVLADVVVGDDGVARAVRLVPITQ